MCVPVACKGCCFTGSTWAERHLRRYQSTARGPTRSDPFFQESETFLLDEPLLPAQWNRYLTSLERLGSRGASGCCLSFWACLATGVNGGDGRDAEDEANGGPDEDVLEGEGTSRDGRSSAEGQAPTAGAEERASGSEPSGAEEQAAGAEEEPSGAVESGTFVLGLR